MEPSKIVEEMPAETFRALMESSSRNIRESLFSRLGIKKKSAFKEDLKLVNSKLSTCTNLKVEHS